MLTLTTVKWYDDKKENRMDKLKKIGALWVKDSKSGQKFFSGEIEINGIKNNIIIFKNKYRENDKQPGYNIFLGDESRPQQKPEPQQKSFEDDIPF